MPKTTTMKAPAPWTPPFRYEVFSIFDSKGQRVCDLRGWGFLTGKGGGLGLPEEEAIKLQDQMGEHLTGLLNRSVPKARTTDETIFGSAPTVDLTLTAALRLPAELAGDELEGLFLGLEDLLDEYTKTFSDMELRSIDLQRNTPDTTKKIFLVPGDHSECDPDCCITGDRCDGSHADPSSQQQSFLLGLADLVEKYGADFYYTTADDGIHITLNGQHVFCGFSLTPEELRNTAKEPDRG